MSKPGKRQGKHIRSISLWLEKGEGWRRRIVDGREEREEDKTVSDTRGRRNVPASKSQVTLFFRFPLRFQYA
jgi:hypothetical protein